MNWRNFVKVSILYEEFEKEMDKCRIKGPDMTFYSSYLKKHYTSKRVEELQVILNEIDW